MVRRPPERAVVKPGRGCGRRCRQSRTPRWGLLLLVSHALVVLLVVVGSSTVRVGQHRVSGAWVATLPDRALGMSRPLLNLGHLFRWRARTAPEPAASQPCRWPANPATRCRQNHLLTSRSRVFRPATPLTGPTIGTTTRLAHDPAALLLTPRLRLTDGAGSDHRPGRVGRGA